MEEKIENLEEKEMLEETEEKPSKFNKKKNKEIEKLQEENKELNDKILRLNAEMQNIRRRNQEELSKIYKYEGKEMLKKLLVTMDNFERAINMDNNNMEDEVSKFLEGFKLIYVNLKNELANIGVQEIDCLNEPFNPETMEAVMTENIDGKESGIVTTVLLKGYMYHDIVLRPAMVKVSE